MAFFKDYKILLKLSFIIGFFPFIPNKTNDYIQCTFWTIIYFILYVFSLTIGIIITCILTLFPNRNIYKRIIGIAVVIDNAITLLCFIVTMLLSMFKYKSRMNLLNSINKIDNSLNSIAIKVNFKNTISPKHFLFEYMCLPIYLAFLIYAMGQYQYNNVIALTYYIINAWMSFTLFLITMHIRDLVISLIHRFEIFSKILNFSILNENLKIQYISIFHVFDELYDIEHQMGHCFGSQILVYLINDFVVETATVYCVFVMTIYYEQKFTFGIWMFSVTHILPIIVKNILFTIVMNKLSEQVSFCIYLHRYL